MSELVVRGGTVLTPCGDLASRDVMCRHGRIVALGANLVPSDTGKLVDATGLIVAPGFIDLQLNGGWGCDFTSDPTSITTVAAELPSTGVTAFAPTIVTSSPDRRAAALDALACSTTAQGSAVALGIHLEGPMISPRQPGAHDAAWIGPVDIDELNRWTPANGVTIVTLAPDSDDALRSISTLAAAGVVVSIGHTACTALEFVAARSAGATAVTHLFNAMSTFGHRSPGPVGAALADPEVVAGLICDGIHVDPVAVAMAWMALGPNRLMLVTDATSALGTDTSSAVVLGERTATNTPEGVLTAEGVLAGSNLAMDQAVRNLVAFTGCTLADALGCASRVPADLLGLTDRGRIEVGARADLVLLDQSLRVERTVVNGVTGWKW